MKHFTAAFALLLSVASFVSAYEFDPARDKRAKDFFRSLVIQEIHNFKPEEETQFFGAEVGGKVCVAVADYALFSFKKMAVKGTDGKEG